MLHIQYDSCLSTTPEQNRVSFTMSATNITFVRFFFGSLLALVAGQSIAAEPPPPPWTSCATPDTYNPNAPVTQTNSLTTCFFDLTGSPSSTQTPASAVLNGGIFRVPPTPEGAYGTGTIVGTGVFQPFVRIQDRGNAGSNGVNIEAGFNTDNPNGAGPAGKELDNHDRGGNNWNHSIQLKDIPTVTVCSDGTSTGSSGCKQYYEFLLDINEQGNSPNSGLSLDEFKLFTAASGSLIGHTGYDGTTGFSNFQITGADKRYDMDSNTSPDTGGDASILMDYQNFSGSGNGVDLQALVSVDNFAGLTGDTYVYLYSKFGWTGNRCQQVEGNGQDKGTYSASPCMTPDGTSGAGKSIAQGPTLQKAGELSFGSDAGFEEWSIRKKTPVPATLFLLVAGVAGLAGARRLSTHKI